MKTMAKAVMINTLVIAAQGALAGNSAFPAEAPEFIGLRPNVTYASEHANDRMTAAQSANSGYAVYSAGSGLKNVGVSAGVTYRLTRSWTVSANAQVTQLLGYAAGSPITFSDTSVMLITTLGYRF